MRNELNTIEQIERYLRHEMTAEEKLQFEKEINSNPALKKSVEQQRQLIEGLKTISLKNKAKKAHKKYTIGKKLWRYGGAGLGIIAIIAGSYFISTRLSSSDSDSSQAYTLPELNENGEKLWADADKYLPYQFFTIDGSKDTVLQTEDGIVMAIPAGAFLDESGNPVKGEINFEVKEAINSNDIMKAGLNTRSGDQLLETGGMFYMNARKDGKSLKIDPSKGIYTEVPTDDVKPGMQLYEGKRMADGTIDWVNPKPLEKYLIPVDIHSLNFYPPNYEDTLSVLSKRYDDKKYKDSLYYSYASLFDEKNPEFYSIAINYTEDKVKTDTVFYQNESYLKGRNIFKQECSSCHHPTKSIVGPPLKGALDRWTKAGVRNEIYNWIKNPKKTYDAGIPYVRNLVQIYVSKGLPLMTGHKITNEEISLVLDYANNYNSTEDFSGINPAKIEAIWNNKFNRTLLATREFEERLKVIHQTCNNAVLDIYVNNLDKKLCKIDSMAANIAGGYSDQFLAFAQRGDGRIKDGQGHLEKLKKYYENRAKAVTQAMKKVEKEFWDKDQKDRNKFAEKNVDFAIKDGQRAVTNLVQEYVINHKEAVRQLGYTSVPGPTYGAVVTVVGWNNLDKAVLESVLTRTTLDYTDPITGKKAIIKYEEFTATIKDRNNYDAAFVYLIPDQLDSYMRMEEKNNNYSEKLNELFKHELVCVAYKGKHAYYQYIETVAPGKVDQIELKAVSNKELDKQLGKIKQYKHKQSLLTELSFRHIQQKENLRQKEVQSIVEFRERMKNVVFPCMMNEPIGKPATDTLKIDSVRAK